MGRGITKKNAFILISLMLGVVTFGFQNCSQSKVEFIQNQSSLMKAMQDSSLSTDCSTETLPTPVQRGMNIVGNETPTVQVEQFYELSQLHSCEKLESITWSAGDGTPNEQKNSPQFKHTFQAPGLYVLSARVIRQGDATVYNFYKLIRVTSLCPQGACDSLLGQAFLSGSTLITEGSPAEITLNLPFGAKTPEALPWKVDDHSFDTQGQVLLTININNLEVGKHVVSLALSEAQILTHTVTVVAKDSSPLALGQSCDLTAVQLTGPVAASVNSTVSYSVHAPPCVQDLIKDIRWDFGDKQGIVSGGIQQTHSYTSVGLYHIKVDLLAENTSAASDEGAMSTLARLELSVDISGGSDVLAEVVKPKDCGELIHGQKKQMPEVLSEVRKSCGIDGTQVDQYREISTMECNDGKVTITAGAKELVEAGQCSGQSCVVSETLKLGDNESRILYSQNSPVGACEGVGESRTCKNGVLSGSSSATLDQCVSGCGEKVGANGTKIWVVDGTVKEKKSCAFEEPNIFDIHDNEIQKICENGVLKEIPKSQRLGSLKTEGVCPSYTWVESGRTQCTADCGGLQSALYECRSSTGEIFAGDDQKRCGAKPTAEYACSNKPDLLITETEELVEQISSKSCKAGEIGGVFQTKTVTHTTRCEDNKLVKTDNKDQIPWISEDFCVEMVTHRCSGDSLSPMQSWARLEWMKQCKDSVPYIGRFLRDSVGIEKSPIEQLNSALRKFIAGVGAPQNDFDALNALLLKMQDTFKGYKDKLTSDAQLTDQQKEVVAGVLDKLLEKMDDIKKNPVFAKFSKKEDSISEVTKAVASVIADLKVIDVPLQNKINDLLEDIKKPNNEFVLAAENIGKLIKELSDIKLVEPVDVESSKSRGLSSVDKKNNVVKLEATKVVSLIGKDLKDLTAAATKLSNTVTSGKFKNATIAINRLTYATFKERFYKKGEESWKTWLPPVKGASDYSLRTGTPLDAKKKPLDVSLFACSAPDVIKIAAICTSSCTTAEAQLLADFKAKKSTTFIRALTEKLPEISTLNKESTLGSFKLQQTKVDQFITEFEDANIPLLTFTMASGKQVKFTKNHPILTAKGQMKTAENFKIGDSFLKLDRQSDKIVEISEELFHGKVYNVALMSSDPKENILVTEGYLNGTSWYQNAGSDLVNQEILARQLISGTK